MICWLNSRFACNSWACTGRLRENRLAPGFGVGDDEDDEGDVDGDDDDDDDDDDDGDHCEHNHGDGNNGGDDVDDEMLLMTSTMMMTMTAKTISTSMTIMCPHAGVPPPCSTVSPLPCETRGSWRFTVLMFGLLGFRVDLLWNGHFLGMGFGGGRGLRTENA